MLRRGNLWKIYRVSDFIIRYIFYSRYAHLCFIPSVNTSALIRVSVHPRTAWRCQLQCYNSSGIIPNEHDLQRETSGASQVNYYSAKTSGAELTANLLDIRAIMIAI